MGRFLSLTNTAFDLWIIQAGSFNFFQDFVDFIYIDIIGLVSCAHNNPPRLSKSSDLGHAFPALIDFLILFDWQTIRDAVKEDILDIP